MRLACARPTNDHHVLSVLKGAYRFEGMQENRLPREKKTMSAASQLDLQLNDAILFDQTPLLRQNQKITIGNSPVKPP